MSGGGRRRGPDARVLFGEHPDEYGPRSQPRQRCERIDAMGLGAATVKNLELIQCAADGLRKNSLLGLLDKTRTAMGARLLKEWLLYPLTDLAAIHARHQAVDSLVQSLLFEALFVTNWTECVT